ncbi:NAD-dependent epimerase/dehydratase family protein [Acidimicrobiia bacterium]|nr:NAD-dependent epimerase/dehydratase family protein [Acidimicrobiia bacterium]
MKNINVCILGAGGQLGSSLLNRLIKNENFKIFAIDKIFINKLENNNLEYIQVDVKKDISEAFLNIPNDTVFINCIGIQHALLSKKIMSINYRLNKKIFDYINIHYSNFKFIHISSLSVDYKNQDLISPGSGNAINLYGVSKLKFEEYLSHNRTDGKFITIIRPAAFYDLKLSANLENFFDLLVNKFFILPSTNIQRSFLSLSYFSKFLEEFILRKEIIDIFEIADEDPIEFNSLLLYLKDSQVEVKSKIIYLPKFLFRVAGYAGYYLEKIGIHLAILTILGEFGYDYIANVSHPKYSIHKENTYTSFRDIIKLTNSK